jgi:hypothetical protein
MFTVNQRVFIQEKWLKLGKKNYSHLYLSSSVLALKTNSLSITVKTNGWRPPEGRKWVGVSPSKPHS